LIVAPVPHSSTRFDIHSSRLSSRSRRLPYPPNRMSLETRSGYVAANKTLIAQPSEYPKSVARLEPTASITARTSSIRCSSEGASYILSDKPCPRLSKVTTRANLERRRRKAVHPANSCWNSMFDMKPGIRIISTGPSPITGHDPLFLRLLINRALTNSQTHGGVGANSRVVPEARHYFKKGDLLPQIVATLLLNPRWV
jgi:hypothetical protein